MGVGLLFLAREGLSYAMLKRIPQPPAEVPQAAVEESEAGPAREHARVAG